MLKTVCFLYLFLLCKGKVSASDCIEKEEFVGKNFRKQKNITTVDKEGCKQECLREDSNCVLYTYKYYNNEQEEIQNGTREKGISCELFSDTTGTELVPYEDSTHDEILTDIFGRPFNVTSGYCHKPSLTNLNDLDAQDPIDNNTWSRSEKGLLTGSQCKEHIINNREAKSAIRGLSVWECQKLCNITDGCNFFNHFESYRGKTACTLKYALGNLTSKEGSTCGRLAEAKPEITDADKTTTITTKTSATTMSTSTSSTRNATTATCTPTYSQWSNWSSCVSENCTEEGTKTRSRNITNVCDYEYDINDNYVMVNITETEEDEEHCTVQLSQWGEWSDCDLKTCVRTRSRTVNSRRCIGNEKCKNCTNRDPKFIYISQTDEKQPSILAPLIISILVIVLLAMAAFGFKFRNKIQDFYHTTISTSGSPPTWHQAGARDKMSLAALPSNNNTVLLTKDSSLKPNITKLLEKDPQLDLLAEFAKVERKAKIEFEGRPMMNEEEEHLMHNRYRDMVAYEDNVISLSSEKGNPPTSYVNASPISFENCPQTFIATQAPRSNTFQNFWTMILEQRVRVIVMITALKEGGRTKAEKYWPDEADPIMDLGNGITLELVSKSYQGTYFTREIRVVQARGQPRLVTQLQTVKWADMTAPDDTKIMRDLVDRARAILVTLDTAGQFVTASRDNRDTQPILVHCSAGVGRTGTFIAVYKLVEEYYDDTIRHFDVFGTVNEMRAQRIKMVQKPEQYVYIFKCLRDEIRITQGNYYEV